jgi:hypothetical protein
MSDSNQPAAPKPIRDKAESCCAKYNYDTCVKIRKFATILAAALLVTVSIVNLINVKGRTRTAA